MNTKQIGEITEACVLTAFLKMGYAVMIPFGDNQRYDLVIEDDGKFQRVQCKTGRIRDGCVCFNASSNCGYQNRERKDYRGEADLFVVYCPDNGKIYAIPVDKGLPAKVSLRLDPTRNSQACGVRWAVDYEMDG